LTKVPCGLTIQRKPRRTPRPADWEIGMTVCIAAIAESGKSIISVTDQMLGAGVMTADLPMMLKGKRIAQNWTASFAGNDVSVVPPIMRKVEERLDGDDASEVGRVFASVYQEERARVAEETILSPLGLDMKSFLDLLITENSPELADLQRRIQMLDFDPVFLVAGFDEKGFPHILTVESPGTVRHYDSVGFWSIGSGAEAALSSLFYRRYHVYQSWQKALYMIAEAKFMSESSANVGKSSLFNVMNRDGTWALLLNPDSAPLRTIWEDEGRPPLPENLDERISEIVKPDSFAPAGDWKDIRQGKQSDDTAKEGPDS
jgi:hypothetical protein